MTTRLSPCELKVLNRLIRGLNSAQICAELYKSKKTIESHRKSIMTKLKCKSAFQAGYKVAKDNIL